MGTVTSQLSDAELRYPVGQYTVPDPVTSEQLNDWICEIEHLPAHLRQAIAGLTDEQLDTPYRPQGWSVRQVVHHLADSHLNSQVRFRLALTEANPLIKPYNEAAWAELPDARTSSVDGSLSLLTGLHRRWALLLRSLSDADWKKTFRHPEYEGRDLSLEWAAGLYAWHCRHHLAHITGLRERNHW
jgi:hypothetical protein